MFFLLGAHLSSLFKPWKATGTPQEWFRFSASLWKDLIFTEQKTPLWNILLADIPKCTLSWTVSIYFTDIWETNLWRHTLADVLREVIQSLGLSDPDMHLPSSFQLQNIWVCSSNTQCAENNLMPLSLTRSINIIENFWAGILISTGISTTLLPNNFHCFKNVSCSNCHHNITHSLPAADTNSLALGLLSQLPLQTGLPPYFLLEGLHHREGWSSPMIEKYFLAALHHRSSPGRLSARPRLLTSQTPDVAILRPACSNQPDMTMCSWWMLFAVVISWWCADIKLNKQSSG